MAIAMDEASQFVGWTGVTKSLARALRWLIRLERGSTTREIAALEGLATRTVQEQIQRIRDWLQHAEQQKALANPDDPLRLLMSGVSGRACEHGRPARAGISWLCIDCLKTNNPRHWALRRGKPIKDPGRYPAGTEWPEWDARLADGTTHTLWAKNRVNARNVIKRLLGLKSRDRMPHGVTLTRIRG
jgi:hypothetical protein